MLVPPSERRDAAIRIFNYRAETTKQLRDAAMFDMVRGAHYKLEPQLLLLSQCTPRRRASSAQTLTTHRLG